jgi:hypothetical protein
MNLDDRADRLSGYKLDAAAGAERDRRRAQTAAARADRASAWAGFGLMIANTAIALLDLFLLAGGIPR